MISLEKTLNSKKLFLIAGPCVIENEKIKSEFRYIKFLFFKSNLIFIGKKI